MMEYDKLNEIEIYKSSDAEIEVQVTLQGDTVWLNRHQMALLFDRDVKTIGKHINTVFKDGELEENSTVAKFATVQKEGTRTVERDIEYYNLDVIISVGYRVKSKRGTQFRQWATQRLKDYLVQGYAINEKRLAEKKQQVEYLKTGIKILSRAIAQQASTEDSEALEIFANGLQLLDDYDHEQLDMKGITLKDTIYPSINEYLNVVHRMKSDFDSDVFAKPKDRSFESSVNQIQQTFDNEELYPTIEEKAAMLLYLVVKNHSFVDGNKRIAAACFLHFLNKNNLLFSPNGQAAISNEALAALTLFVATSKSDEMETVKMFIISILNRSIPITRPS
ncbi:virulence RhuM family protein [Sphingobacterium sp. UT-1RO-CII-1]|uniref:RhuM family protein n=1 Tax=Sphingobacterium sp. UT-1RO-CII-1 TaxID=2995225 RepID=UPI00227A0A3C|nr:RhuM family protein [Sphingobacterium sp. UT-1RO-CII-1]MCY4779097.1 virulence RhuM family protein [Sphingobacterium sp. UT-1RO-CII-1]